MNSSDFRVAFATDDGTTISPHFGRAQYFEVVTVERGIVTRHDRYEKTVHHKAGQEHGHAPGGDGADASSEAAAKHGAMTAGIGDCQIVVARGMGFGAYEHIAGLGMRPIVTQNRLIADAVRELIDGTIVDHKERLH